jgi:hypothetical protein
MFYIGCECSLCDGSHSLVQVFRTYNASITLDRLLIEQVAIRRDGMTTEEKKVEYDKANKEVI